jgi:CCCH-type zinc finger
MVGGGKSCSAILVDVCKRWRVAIPVHPIFNMRIDENNSSTGGLKTEGDAFSIAVKPEFVLDARAPSLAPIPEPTTLLTDHKDDRDNGNNDSKKGKHHKRGRNKKRPRDARIDTADKVCLAVMRGESCVYGDQCRFSHDVKAYLATRPADIAVEGLATCPHFETSGSCPFGVMCRLGASHINLATGQNITKNAGDAEKVQGPDPVVNILSAELQTQLRKNTYPFVCQRKNKPAPKITPAAPECSESVNETDQTRAQAPMAENESRSMEPSLEPAKDAVDSPFELAPPMENDQAAAEPMVDLGAQSKVECEGTTSLVKDVEMASPKLSDDFGPLPQKTRKIIDFSNKV